jgi:hypothetical protein
MSTDPAELERLAARSLGRLPQPRAPHTLLPRVLTAVARAAARPWYQRAWRSWPVGLQAASAAIIVLAAAAAMLALPGALAAAREFTPLPASIAAPVRTIGAISEAAVIFWRLVVAPVAPYLALFLFVMSLAAVVFATALDRVVALGGVSRS